jgi:hypothetical protein
MKQIILVTSAVVALIVTGMIACNSGNGTPSKDGGMPITLSSDSLVKRGQYLVSIMGCDDCHSPKIMGPQGPQVDPALRLSGHPANLPVGKVDPLQFSSWINLNHMGTAAAGPWGISFSANLTSHPSGIGNWTEEQFFRAIREGKAKGVEGARTLLPPMPWFQYARASDEDLRAIFAFLKSTPPVDNTVPAPVPLNKLNQQ